MQSPLPSRLIFHLAVTARCSEVLVRFDASELSIDKGLVLGAGVADPHFVFVVESAAPRLEIARSPLLLLKES